MLPGYNVMLYSQPGFEGSSVLLTQNVSCLQDSSSVPAITKLGGTISSYRISSGTR